MAEDIRTRLFALQDHAYRDFQCALMPTVPREKVIGVRTPQLRRLARALHGTPEADAFLHALPHAYYEEDNLHGFLIEYERDIQTLIALLDDFLPHVDNWATCDGTAPKAFKNHPEELLAAIRRWLKSPYPYTVRYGLGMLMRHFLDERFAPEYLALAASVRSEHYYIRMMAAWYFATALAKQYEAAFPYLAERRLEPWVHKKAIQKAIESFRIPDERKAVLKKLRKIQ